MFSLKLYTKVFLALLLLTALGTLSFVVFEGYTVMDSIWLTVITMASVGYGDIVPHTLAGRISAMLMVIGGVGLFTYLLSGVFSVFLEGQMAELWWRRKMMKRISRLRTT
ncbi:MAG: potassium channel family protein [Bacillota bacterium]